MSRIDPGPLRPIASWDGFAKWLAESFDNLETADVFDIGPMDALVGDVDVETPCAQAIALDGGVLLRLSTTQLGVPPLLGHFIDDVALDVWHHGEVFDDCTFGFIVSTDVEFLALTCVSWFRDAHRLQFTELGCELVPSVSLQGA